MTTRFSLEKKKEMPKTRNTITAPDIVQCLARKHNKDVFVAQCKDGPSQGASGFLRMDAWVMNRSWVNACVTVYEIKVSRSDFLQDDKWHAYLPLCNKFYFVCPYKMIQPEEVPPEAGLLWVTAKATRAHTKRKAPYRDVEIPETVWRYILMCRARIGHEYQVDRPNTRAYWREWLKQKEKDRELGYMVSRAIRRQYDDMKEENCRLKAAMESYDSIRTRIQELGFNPDEGVSSWEWEGFEAKLKGEIPQTLKRHLRWAAQSIQQLLEEFEASEKPKEPV